MTMPRSLVARSGRAVSTANRRIATRRTATRRAARAALLVATIAIGAGSAGVGPAGAQTPTLAVSATELPAGQPSTVDVFGTSYLVPPHAPDRNVFGGVYVLFGWVAPGTSWGPSSRNGTDSNGQFGITYSYAGASRSADTRDDGTGNNRFVSFTAGGISGESTPFHMTMDPATPDNSRGSWATTITVPGSVYQWQDPATGVTHTVDCQQVQCGIYTIGAHGVASPTNERFTPITFRSAGGGSPAPVATVPATSGTSPSGGTGGAPTSPSPGASPGPTVAGRATGRAPSSPAAPSTTLTPGGTGTTDTVPVESTTTVADPATATTSTEAAPTTISRRPTRGDVESASGEVIVMPATDDGVDGWVWAAGVGVPVAAAAGLIVCRRRSIGVAALASDEVLGQTNK